jgi:hypothetical protein
METATLVTPMDDIFKLLSTDVSAMHLQLPFQCSFHIVISTGLSDVASALETAVKQSLREQDTDLCLHENEAHSTASCVSIIKENV